MARKAKEPIQKSSQEPGQQVEMTQNNPLLPDDENQTEYAAHNRSRCGGVLRLTRENQGLAVQDIASRLRISPKQIEAIEADNFAILPEPTIVRGFIRNYAKLLKISAEPLLDAYNVLVPSNAPHEFTIKPASNMKVTSYDKPKSGRYIWAGLALLVGLGAWLFYQNYVEKPSPIKPSASMNSVEPLPEIALPAAERASEPQAVTELTLPIGLPPAADARATVTNEVANQALSSNASVGNVAPANTPAPEPISPGIEPVEPAVASPANGTARLEFNANQETWVSVVDVAGKEVFNKTIFAGSRESVDITPPVNVVVGNAGATSMSMNGKPVDLAPHSRQNVAHIKLE
ncbi:MAG: RodZ domain-containing protein [Methylotenera sp.]